MMFRTNDLLNDFERLTKGLDLGPDFDKKIHDLSSAFAGTFAGSSNLDVVRSEDCFELFIDLPGVDPDAVDLTVEGRTLNVSASRSFHVSESQEHVYAGRRHGDFHRSFKLADDLDVDQLTARSEHGVLIISVPVNPAAMPRRIPIDTRSIDNEVHAD